MGPLGGQEMVLIFIVVLVLFGPKKLPELGRTVGKVLTQFRHVSSEMKASFEREMQNLERETESLKEAANSADHEIRSHTYDYQVYDEAGYPMTPASLAVSNEISVSASGTSSAESQGATETASYYAQPVEPAPGVEGTVPRGQEEPKPAVGTPQHS